MQCTLPRSPLIIIKMLDTSNNLTLEQEVYSNNQLDSLALSEVKYQEKYNFLEDQSFHGEYLEVSRLRIEPPLNKYQMHFYQGKELADQTEETWSAATNQKIGTFKSANGDKQKQCIKLPLSQENVLLEINSRLNSPLRGKLLKTAGDTQISLFDNTGKEKGKLSYHLEEIKKKEDGMVNHSITLQEKDFLEDLQAIKKNLEKQNNKRQKIEVKCRSTLKTDQSDPLPEVDSEQERSQKSEIDYMGYQGENSRAVKAAQYRLPLQSKNLYIEPVRVVDFSMIRKSMDNLGIPNNSQLQKFLQRKRILEKVNQQTSLQSQRQTLQQKSAQALVQQMRSYQDFSSQMQQARPQVKDYGVGTYTPLPSRMIEQRIGSNTSNRKSQMSAASARQKQTSRSRKKEKLRLELQEPIPQTQLHRKLKQRNSPILHESIKQQDSIIRHSHSIDKRNQLSMRNKVYEVRVGQSRAGSRLEDSKQKQWQSCRENTSNHVLDRCDSQDSILYPQFDFLINNLSVNFHQQSFGSKFVELAISPTAYRTQQLRGSNLIWIGKSYLFRGVNGHCQLVISVKIANEQLEETLGRVRVRLSDIVLNRKKSYFQTFLLGKQSVLAIVIIGFQVVKRTLALERRPVALKLARQSHAQTEISRSKTTKVQRKVVKKANQPQNLQHSKLPQPRANPIRSKKYVGGRNIKIGRASRFQQDGLDVPGPGDYFIDSSFSRHALKDY